MVHETRPTLWTRVYAVSTWTLIGYFSLMAAIHVVAALGEHSPSC